MSVAPTVDPSTELSQTAHGSKQPSPLPPAPSEPSLQVVSGMPHLDAPDSFSTVPQDASTPAKSNNPAMFEYFNSEKGIDQDGNPWISAAQSNYVFEEYTKRQCHSDSSLETVNKRGRLEQEGLSGSACQDQSLAWEGQLKDNVLQSAEEHFQNYSSSPSPGAFVTVPNGSPPCN